MITVFPEAGQWRLSENGEPITEPASYPETLEAARLKKKPITIRMAPTVVYPSGQGPWTPRNLYNTKGNYGD